MTANDATAEPDPLDRLAAEVGFGVGQELQREGLLGKVRSGAATAAHVPLRVPALVKDKVAELVDAGLDRVYAQPLDIDSADEALALLTALGEESSGTEPARRVAGILAAAGPILVRVARGTGALATVARAGTKVVPTGRMVTVGTTAVLASVRIGVSARAGTRELQILASYLMSRLRAAGLPIDRDLVEQVVVHAYLHPDVRLALRPGAHRGFGGLAKLWSGRGIKAPSAAKQDQLQRKRVAAIERLDVGSLVADWQRAQSPAGPVAPLALPAG